MHNGLRPAGADLKHGPALGQGYKPGELVMGTEEDFNNTTCDGEGQFTIASLEGSYDGEGWSSTPEDPFRLKKVGTWSPKDKEGDGPAQQLLGPLLRPRQRPHRLRRGTARARASWTSSDPRNPIQVAYFRPGRRQRVGAPTGTATT